MQQFDLFQSASVERPGAEFVAAALNPSAMFIIPCGAHKAAAATEARSLYISDNFRSIVRLMDNLRAKYVISSARHGLLKPDRVIEPYDLDLSALPSEDQAAWGKAIISELARNTYNPIIVLSTGIYAESIMSANNALSRPLKIYSPLANLSDIHAREWIREAASIGERFHDLQKLYKIIDQARIRGETFLLKDISNRKIPKRGVYLFLDKVERIFLNSGPRIVRIGTHAVSHQSKSTLKSRLRNHLGPAHGVGNHRGSIFRLHVGRAMLETKAEGLNALPSWGTGQKAEKSILVHEELHEHQVTEYLGELEVFLIDANDEPSKDSLRAIIETQLIGLLTANYLPVEVASSEWLGNFSPVSSIEKTKIWNIRDVGRPYWPEKHGSVSDIIAGIIA